MRHEQVPFPGLRTVGVVIIFILIGLLATAAAAPAYSERNEGSPTGTESPVSSDYPAGPHTSPAIAGDLIIWRGTDPVNLTSGILLYNLSSGRESVIATGPDDYENNVPPAIDGNYAAWQEYGPNGTYQIRIFDLTRQEILATPAWTDGAEKNTYDRRGSADIHGNGPG